MRKITPIFILFLFLCTAAGGTVLFLIKAKKSNFQVGLVNQPELTGPGLLCNEFGTIIGSYSGGGNPATDLYSWKIFGPSNTLLFSRGPGAFQSIDVTFIQNGFHSIELEVIRGGVLLSKFKKNVEVVSSPKILLQSEYLICSGQNITVNAIDPSSSNFSSYIFEWKDNSGNVVGNNNSLTITQAGDYSVSFFLTNSAGEKACQYELKSRFNNISSFSIIGSGNTVCSDSKLNFETDPPLFGEWFVQKVGNPIKKSLGKSNSVEIDPGLDLTDFGAYELIFILDNPNNPPCRPEKKFTFNYTPQPFFQFESSLGASDCFKADGKLTLTTDTDLDLLIVEGTGITLGPFSAGDLIEIPNLKSGTYNLIGVLGTCSNSIGSVVPLINRPPSLDFELTDITGEACTEDGKTLGSFKVTLKSNPGSDVFYRVLNEKGEVAKDEPLPNSSEFIVEISGGKFFFEIYTKDDECILPWSEVMEIPGKFSADFTIPEQINICQSSQFIPSTSQALEFKLINPDQTFEIKKAGEEFNLNQAGEHILIGFIPNQSDICPTEKRFIVNLIDPIDFDAELISEDCIIGNRSYQANVNGKDPSQLLFFWRNELNEIIGTGQTLFLPPTSFGTYSLEVQPANSEACPIEPKKFEAKKPVLSVDLALKPTKLCEYGPKAIVELSFTFPEEVTDIEWRRYDDLGNIEPLPQFKDKKQIIADVAGIYEAAVFSRIPSINKDCELGRSLIDLDLLLDKVDFDIPTSLSICDPYSLIPDSSSPLEFELTYPDGSIQIKNWNEPFIIDQEGSYTLLGYDPDIKGPLCPNQKTFDVVINQPVQFSQELVDLTCDGEYTYQAIVDNYLLTEVDFFWRDPNGNLVSTTSELKTRNYGVFTLEVQPNGSFPCSNQEISFEIPIPILSIPVQIDAETLCPDQPDAALKLVADLEQEFQIEWWFTDLSNNQSELINEKGKTEILANEEGTYEVRIINQFGCLLGFDNVLVIRSTDQVRPILEESYLICPRYEIAPTLNPGSFSGYEWYFGDQLVSTNPTYKPNQIGTYNLIVFSQEGCAYETTFITKEECDLKVSYPNAIQPGNPDKGFLIYSNYLVDELDVWIFNKWGNLVFHCQNSAPIKDESTCIWDGYYNGKKVLPGTYAVKIKYRNLEKNILEEEFGAILVIY